MTLDNLGDGNVVSLGNGDEAVGEIENGIERRGDTEPMSEDMVYDDDPESFVGDEEDEDWLDEDEEEVGL